jgi:hypothetical protein
VRDPPVQAELGGHPGTPAGTDHRSAPRLPAAHEW